MSGGTRSDVLLSLVVKPDGDELSQGRAVLTEDPECPIAGAGHGAGFLDDVAQEGGEIEVSLDQEGGIEYATERGGVLNGAMRHQPGPWQQRL